MKEVLTLLLLMPSLVHAEGAAGAEFSFLSSFFQMITALAIVVGLIYVSWYATGKLGKGLMSGRSSSRHIRLVETRYIAPKKSLILVEVAGEYLLLASSGERLELIKQIDMLEEIEVVEESASASSGYSGVLSRLVGR